MFVPRLYMTAYDFVRHIIPRKTLTAKATRIRIASHRTTLFDTTQHTQFKWHPVTQRDCFHMFLPVIHVTLRKCYV